MFDCGEATTHQIMRTTLKPSNVSKIFITHLHGDHVLGLISFLSHIGDRPDADHSSHIHDKLSVPTNLVEVYGPSGIREYIRSNLRLTQTHSPLRIKVNELLRRNRDQIYGPSLSHTNGPNRLWHSEVLGEDIWCDEQGLWKDVVRLEECGVSVSAAPIQHTIDCVGYFLKESNRREKFDMAKLNPILKEHSEEIKKMGFKVLPAILSELEKTRNPVTFSTGVTIHPPKLSVQGRKVIILGDTSNPGPILSLLDLKDDERVDLLVHESTGTSISELDCKTEESEGSVSRRMRERGHSTSLMAGKFARRCKAKRLILNHLGGKFPAPLGCLCPDEAILAELPHYSHSLRVQHASLWKSFEELKPAQREKIKTELVWIRSVEDDALKGSIIFHIIDNIYI
ncbi:beta-lactamase-like protein [Phakopsora pachyrhizi]|nr:beta-lactamase-like protein [Phakopsora pachyrhizi]